MSDQDLVAKEAAFALELARLAVAEGVAKLSAQGIGLEAARSLIAYAAAEAAPERAPSRREAQLERAMNAYAIGLERVVCNLDPQETPSGEIYPEAALQAAIHAIEEGERGVDR